MIAELLRSGWFDGLRFDDCDGDDDAADDDGMAEEPMREADVWLTGSLDCDVTTIC